MAGTLWTELACAHAIGRAVTPMRDKVTARRRVMLLTAPIWPPNFPGSDVFDALDTVHRCVSCSRCHTCVRVYSVILPCALWRRF